MEYQQFLEKKRKTFLESGFTIDESELNPKLKYFQKLGFKMLKEMQKDSMDNEEYLADISGIYHEINSEIKKSLEQKLCNKHSI